MNNLRLLIMLLAAAFPLLVASGGAQAQATRTWVSGVGDDANPCSRTAPCKTFAGTISKTAAGGEINTLDPGGFGALTITKAITLVNDGAGTAGFLVGGTPGITVSAGPTDVVVISGFDFEGTGSGTNGIVFNTGGSLIVDHTRIAGFTGSGILFQPSATSSLVVTNSQFYNNNPSGTGAGINVVPAAGGSAQVTISHVISDRSHAGIKIDGTTGTALNATISDCVTDDNVANGIVVTSGTAITTVNVTRCVASNNSSTGIGVHADGANTTLYLNGSTVASNSIGLKTTNGGILYSYGNNAVSGNTAATSGTISTTPLQ